VLAIEDLAITAWRELGPSRVQPTRIDALTEPLRPTSVYRLEGVGKAQSAVIAKRCQHQVAAIERSIYEDILPEFPFPTLEYYGCVKEPRGGFSWLFVEDASDDPRYEPRVEQHRVAAGRWLGVMNVSAAALPAARRLPDRGPGHYLELLESAHRVLLAHFAGAAMDVDDRALLDGVLGHCRRLSTHWSQVVHICQGVPQTLVHGDFISNNVRLRTTGEETSLFPFDWEKAGWGTPAEDISRVDIPTYRATVEHHWPELHGQALAQLADVGKVFRSLVFLDWVAKTIDNRSVEQSMDELRRCRTWLDDVSRALRWDG
jgi:hypothetical protein